MKMETNLKSSIVAQLWWIQNQALRIYKEKWEQWYKEFADKVFKTHWVYI